MLLVANTKKSGLKFLIQIQKLIFRIYLSTERKLMKKMKEIESAISEYVYQFLKLIQGKLMERITEKLSDVLAILPFFRLKN